MSKTLGGLTPCRTLFDADTSEWLQQDSADPINSWPIEAVQSSGMSHGIPKKDQYGRLYFYIRDKLERFCQRTASAKKLLFHLYCMNAVDLPVHLNSNLESMKFDRVEVANIVDVGYLGLQKTLQTCGCLLKTSAENPHATLIALFMNATHLAEMNLGDAYSKKSLASAMKTIVKFAPPKVSRSSRSTAAIVRTMAAKEIFRDLDHLFTHYMILTDFSKASREAGMSMKATNTVIDAWPLRLWKEYGEPGAQEAFDRLVASGSVGSERYVEWVRNR